MSHPSIPFWDHDETNNTAPATAKLNGGSKSGRPEAAQYFNWLFVQIWKWIRGFQGAYHEVVVGSSAQVTTGVATHVLADLNNALVVDDSKVLFLFGSHVMGANLSLTNDNIEFSAEPGAEIVLGTYDLTISGFGVKFAVPMDRSSTGVFSTMGAGKQQGHIAPPGYLVANGFLQQGDTDFAGEGGAANNGDIIVREFTCDVAGTVISKTGPTVLTGVMDALTVDAWHAITVNQDGVVALEGTALTGAITGRPTGGGTGVYGIDTLIKEWQGFYKDSATRFIGAVWVDVSADSGNGLFLYAVEMGHGSDEKGDNSRGSWTITGRVARMETVESATATTTTTVGSVYRSGNVTINYPLILNPGGTGDVDVVMDVRASAGAPWAGGAFSRTGSTSICYLMGWDTANAATVRALVIGQPTHLA